MEGQKDTAELKSCPFCGDTDIEIVHRGSYCNAWCPRCGGRGGLFEYDREDDAKAAWNTRAESRLVKELAEALEKAQAGLQWYMSEFAEVVTDADHEMQAEIDAVLARYKPKPAAGAV